MSFKQIECPNCHAMLRSKYEVRDVDEEIRKWKWLTYCPVCGKRLKVVFGKPWNCIKGVEVVDDVDDDVDRDTLLALASSIEERAACSGEYKRSTAASYARCIREALGVVKDD